MNWFELVLGLWLSIALLNVLGSVAYVGYNDDDLTIRKDEVIVNAAFWGIIWPFALALLIVLSPFLGVYYLARYLGNRRKGHNE